MIPDTVQAVLAARIDLLPPAEKRLLQTAAVIGHEVPLYLLRVITDLPAAVLQHGLARLQAGEFIYETRPAPEQEFTFKHTLTHEVVYSSLLLERRRVLHERIVEVLEVLYADRLAEQIERLAHHAWRSAMWDKAFVYFRQAGVKAMTHSATREAMVYFEQALDALRRLPESHDTIEQVIDLRLDRTRILRFSRVSEPLGKALRQKEFQNSIAAGDSFVLTGPNYTPASRCDSTDVSLPNVQRSRPMRSVHTAPARPLSGPPSPARFLGRPQLLTDVSPLQRGGPSHGHRIVTRT
jgi:hypothetical protein